MIHRRKHENAPPPASAERGACVTFNCKNRRTNRETSFSRKTARVRGQISQPQINHWPSVTVILSLSSLALTAFSTAAAIWSGSAPLLSARVLTASVKAGHTVAQFCAALHRLFHDEIAQGRGVRVPVPLRKPEQLLLRGVRRRVRALQAVTHQDTILSKIPHVFCAHIVSSK